MIAIFGTTQDDIIYFLARMEKKIMTQLDDKVEVYTGQYSGTDVVICATGYSNLLSAMVTSEIITKYNPYLVISIGTAYSTIPSIKQGDVFIADRIYFSDVDFVNFNRSEFGQIPSCPAFTISDSFTMQDIEQIHYRTSKRFLFKGALLSGNKFYTNLSDIEQIIHNHYAYEETINAYDTTTGGISLVSYRHNVPFVAIKAISYEIGNKEQEINYIRKGLEVMPTIGEIIKKLLK